MLNYRLRWEHLSKDANRGRWMPLLVTSRDEKPCGCGGAGWKLKWSVAQSAGMKIELWFDGALADEEPWVENSRPDAGTPKTRWDRSCTAILASTEAFKSSRVHMHRTRGRDSIFNRREEGRSLLLRTIVLVYNKISLYLFRRYNSRLKIFLND